MTFSVPTTGLSDSSIPTSDGTSMQTVTLLFKCQPGMGAVLLEAFTASLGDTRAFDGCLSVKTFVDADNPDTVMLIEEWDSKDQRGLSRVANRVRHDRFARARVGGALRDALLRITSRVGAHSTNASTIVSLTSVNNSRSTCRES